MMGDGWGGGYQVEARSTKKMAKTASTERRDMLDSEDNPRSESQGDACESFSDEKEPAVKRRVGEGQE